MKKGNLVSVLLGGLLFIGFSVQILLGLWWMGANFTSLQLFGDTAFQVKVSGTMACDDYTGFLYPAILLLARVVGMLPHIPWFCVMYVLQLGLAGFSGFWFLRSVGFQKGHPFWCAWGSLVLLTFPMCMQCHLAVLPDSFVFSLLLLETSFARIALRNRSVKGIRVDDLCRCALFWVLLGFTACEYVFLGAIPVVFLLIVHL